jgi:transposase-like protein
MKRRHRHPEEWRSLVTEWKESGESAIGFASRLGVSTQTLYRWRAILEGVPRTARTASLAKIIEVRTARLPGDDKFEVRLTDGRSVGIPASFDETALARLLRVLEAAA